MGLEEKGKKFSTVGMVGLGVMGSPISANIVKGGFSVCGYDIRKEKIDMLVANGGMAAASPREVAERADVVLISLPSLSAFEMVIRGEKGILSSGRSGLVPPLACGAITVSSAPNLGCPFLRLLRDR